MSDTSVQSIDIFPWDDNFNTGLDEIDRQHRKLVQLLNVLASHLAFHTDLPQLHTIIEELKAYTVYHFQAEEAIWHEFMPGEEDSVIHQAAHDRFVKTILQFQTDQLTKPNEAVVHDALAFLAKWLASHILETDRHMAYVVLALRDGLSLDAARQQATEQMSGATRVLIDIILSIYDKLSANTMKLMRELVEHKRAEDLLAQESEKNRFLLRNASDGVHILDTKGNVLDASDSFCEQLGYTRDEVLGLNVADWDIGQTAGQISDRITRLFEHPERIVIETTHQRKDGTSLEVEISVCPMELLGTKALYCASRDISARKRGDQALRESEERYRLVVESAAEGFWMIDADYRTTYINKSLSDILGYSMEDMLGRRPAEFADEENKKIFLHQMARISNSQHRHYEIQLRHKAGHNVPLLFQATTHFDPQGKVILSFAFITDLTERKRTEERLASRELELRTIIDCQPECVKLLAEDSTLLQMNRAGLDMIDADSAEQVVGQKVLGIIKPEYRKDFAALNKKVFQGGAGTLEFEIIGLKGSHRWLETHAVPLRSPQGNITALLGVTRDITARKAAEQALRIAAIAFESQEGMMVTDADARIVQVNQAFMRLTGYTAEEVIGKTPAFLNSGKQTPTFYQELWSELKQRDTWQGEVWNRRKNGEIYPEWLVITAVRDAHDAVTHYVGAFTDITTKKEAEQKILNLAFYDALTGLPNRRLLTDRLEQARLASHRSGSHGALIYLDLDRFKSLNDSQGHSIGDLLLTEVARRLEATVRAEDTVARFGGDEFVIMLEDLAESAAEAANRAEGVAEKILHVLNQPFMLDRVEHHSSPSIGITLFNGKQDSIEDLLKRADLAMYEAKSSGGNTVVFFDPAMQAAVAARVSLEAELRKAVKRAEFVLHYQPQVNAKDEVVGVEALARWQHPERGQISPYEFITLAEETHLIIPIGHQLIMQACELLRHWSGNPATAHLTISVNVSPRQFHHPDFVPMVVGALQASGARPDRLLLEITENVLMDNLEENIAKMTELRNMGIRFSIDDFGTGYSSMAYLKRLPLDELKIDRSFVADIDEHENAAVICSTFIGLAHLLGLRVVAEGVETQAQRHFLATTHRCDLLQGYLFSRPLPRAELEQALSSLAPSAGASTSAAQSGPHKT